MEPYQHVGLDKRSNVRLPSGKPHLHMCGDIILVEFLIIPKRKLDSLQCRVHSAVAASSRNGRNGLSYLDDNLASGETVLYRTRCHWSDMLTTGTVPGAITLFFFVTVMPGAYSLTAIRNDSDAMGRAIIGAVLSVFSIVWMAFEVAAWWGTETALTNLRIMRTTKGVRRPDTGDTNLGIAISRIEYIQVEQGNLGVLLGYGTIRISVKGAPEAKLGNVPEKFCRLVQERIGGSAPMVAGSSS
jgi:hypothetical protein